MAKKEMKSFCLIVILLLVFCTPPPMIEPAVKIDLQETQGDTILVVKYGIFTDTIKDTK